jgi:flagellar hook-basal body complex protein FliE
MSVPIGSIPMMRITPSTGVSPATPAQPRSGADFSDALRSAVDSALDTGHEAEAQSMKAITQGGNVTEVATALSRAELTLQTATAVRDRMLQAYQDIMRIQI